MHLCDYCDNILLLTNLLASGTPSEPITIGEENIDFQTGRVRIKILDEN